MIAITKSPDIPEKLRREQTKIATRLFEKKGEFNWKTKHYNAPIKDDLKQLYNNKCGYCEVRLTHENLDNKFSIEHYRPKDRKMYYWLGVEWTNLFPACQNCNNVKDNEFPLFNEENRFKQNPFDENGNLISDYCRADSEHLKAEQPLYFHPEIDDFENIFRVEVSGKVVINEGSVTDDYTRKSAEKMLHLLNNPIVEIRRKEKIEAAQEILELSLEEEAPEFPIFFNFLKKNQQPEAEFSLLGKCMVRDFERFFIEDLDLVRENEGLKKLLRFAYRLHFPKPI